ncbi:hypothetical protein [Lederbergia lenta]|uniref:Uncharacterized protein n=1 Tax=Lederbergia lenta TaxID=1467 RepID=A0A2X4W9H1_LEDLE|nr:hypothetical protein [Lederbergia lenta]MCM3110429.1 hypothetical protein [Lederbergia lenta]MEC2324005.1 hypothetical protein [Lederbergia lenta]SQI60846.1 Uncharacterised protein [Lederbergia lenta]
MKHHPVFRQLYIFYFFVFTIHIVNVFIESTRLNYLLGLLAILMLVISIIQASKLFIILSSSFILIGSFLFYTSGQSIIHLPSLLTSNMSLLTLLAMLPWMSSVVRSGRFDRSLNVLMKVNVSDLGKLYIRSSVTTFTLATFLNLSAASISQEVLKENLSHVNKKLRDSFISISTLRGFSLALLWSPLEILLAVSIFATGVTYVSILPWLLLIGAITFILDTLWGYFHFKKYTYNKPKIHHSDKVNIKALTSKITQLSIALVIFLTLVILCGNLFAIDFILTVTLLIFPFTFAWSLIMKRVHSYWTIGWNTWRMKTNTMQNFIVLFISLSFFSNSLSNATFLELIQKPILYVSEYPLIIFFVIQLSFICMSMFGIHPIATIGILGGLITTLLDVLNPLSLAIVLITSSVATLTVGTYGLVVTLTAINTEQSPYRITLNNLPYSFIFGGIGSIIAYVLL